jgi:hypothetical protein
VGNALLKTPYLGLFINKNIRFKALMPDLICRRITTVFSRGFASQER